jgi:hypothetical protein
MLRFANRAMIAAGLRDLDDGNGKTYNALSSLFEAAERARVGLGVALKAFIQAGFERLNGDGATFDVRKHYYRHGVIGDGLFRPPPLMRAFREIAGEAWQAAAISVKRHAIAAASSDACFQRWFLDEVVPKARTSGARATASRARRFLSKHLSDRRRTTHAAASPTQSSSPPLTASKSADKALTPTIKLPDDPNHLDLWKLLHRQQGLGKSDREIAREFSRERGEKYLNAMQVARKRGSISDWRLSR